MNLKALEKPSETQALILLLVAIVLEAGWVFNIRANGGFTRLWPSVVNVLLMVLPTLCLAYAIRRISEPVLYSIWTGSSLVLVTLIAGLFGTEKLSLLKCFGIALIVSGIAMVYLPNNK